MTARTWSIAAACALLIHSGQAWTDSNYSAQLEEIPMLSEAVSGVVGVFGSVKTDCSRAAAIASDSVCDSPSAAICSRPDVRMSMLGEGEMTHRLENSADKLFKIHYMDQPYSGEEQDLRYFLAIDRQVDALFARKHIDFTKLMSGIASNFNTALQSELEAREKASAGLSRMTTLIRSKRALWKTRSIQIFSPSRWLRIPPSSAQAERLDYYKLTCGQLGTKKNAFYDQRTNTFIFCPGLLTTLMDAPADTTAIEQAIAFVAGHELGHAVDFGSFPELYGPMGDCLKRRKWIPEEYEKSWKREITADFWGLRTAVPALTAARTSDSPVGFLRALGTSLCRGYEGDATHPSEELRMNAIIGSDPSLRKAMGCRNSPRPEFRACDLSGDARQVD